MAALLSRRIMAVAHLVFVLLLLVGAETATARVVVGEKMCMSQSRVFKGMCFSSSNCDNICKTAEKFTEGECKLSGATRKCFCKTPC